MDTLETILYLIKKHGYSELEFTEKVGLNKTAVTEWKNGKTKSYLKHIPKIAEVLHVTTDYLLNAQPSDDPVTIEEATNITISERIFQLLNKKLRSQQDLANAINVTSTTVSSWKTKGSLPSADKIYAIANFLEVSLEYLLTGKEETPHMERRPRVRDEYGELDPSTAHLELARLRTNQALTERILEVMREESQKETNSDNKD